MKQYLIGIAEGDKGGAELGTAIKNTLKTAALLYNFRLRFASVELGHSAAYIYGSPLPDVSVETARGCSSVFLTFPGISCDDDDAACRASLSLRRELSADLSIVPVINFPQLSALSPLRRGLLSPRVDMLFVFPFYDYSFCVKESADKETIFDSQIVTKTQVEKAVRAAFALAAPAGRQITLVLTPASGIWEAAAAKALQEHRGVRLVKSNYADITREMLLSPSGLGIILAPPRAARHLLFLASSLCAADGVLPMYCPGEASIYGPALYPAAYYCGRGMVSPIGALLSVALFLEKELGLSPAAARLRRAISLVLDDGYRTQDIFENNKKKISTLEMVDIICEYFRRPMRRASKG